MENLGEVIRGLRIAAGLKVFELAKMVGVNPVYISQIEKHNKLPSQDVLERIEKALGDRSLFHIYIKQKNPAIEKRLEAKHPQSLLPNYIMKEFDTPESKQIIRFIHRSVTSQIMIMSKKDYALLLERIAPKSLENEKLFDQVFNILKEMKREKDAYWNKFTKQAKQIESLILRENSSSK
jgi:transcriptional regulator with XRE-family HTH domain